MNGIPRWVSSQIATDITMDRHKIRPISASIYGGHKRDTLSATKHRVIAFLIKLHVGPSFRS